MWESGVDPRVRGGDPPTLVQGLFGKFNKLSDDGEYFIIFTEVENDVYVGRMPA